MKSTWLLKRMIFLIQNNGFFHTSMEMVYYPMFWIFLYWFLTLWGLTSASKKFSNLSSPLHDLFPWFWFFLIGLDKGSDWRWEHLRKNRYKNATGTSGRVPSGMCSRGSECSENVWFLFFRGFDSFNLIFFQERTTLQGWYFCPLISPLTIVSGVCIFYANQAMKACLLYKGLLISLLHNNNYFNFHHIQSFSKSMKFYFFLLLGLVLSGISLSEGKLSKKKRGKEAKPVKKKSPPPKINTGWTRRIMIRVDV